MVKRRGDAFRLEWQGLDEFIEDLEGMEKDFENNVKKAMGKYGNLAEEGSKALSPRDSGDLESSINFDRPKSQGGSIVVEGGSNLDYALRQHEAPERTGVRDKNDAGVKEAGYYVDGRGRRTRQKPTWRGQQAGRKYMERAIVATEKDFDKIMANALEQTLRGRRK